MNTAAEGVWLMTRIYQPEEKQAHRDRLRLAMQREASGCDRCYGFYMVTGYLPVTCPDCGAKRGPEWIAELERSVDNG